MEIQTCVFWVTDHAIVVQSCNFAKPKRFMPSKTMCMFIVASQKSIACIYQSVLLSCIHTYLLSVSNYSNMYLHVLILVISGSAGSSLSFAILQTTRKSIILDPDTMMSIVARLVTSVYKQS